MKKKLRVFFILSILLATPQLYSNEINFSAIFDTYTGNPAGGVSIDFYGSILKNLEQKSRIDYEYNNSYNAIAASLYKDTFWSAGGGFALILNTHSAYPGLYLEVGANTQKLFSATLEFMLGLDAKNLLTPALYNIKLVTVFNITNAKIHMGIGYSDEIVGMATAQTLFGEFAIRAVNANFPVQIAMNTNIEYIRNPAYEGGFSIAFDIGGILYYVTQSSVTYLVGGTYQALNLSNPEPAFSVIVGIELNF